MTAVFVEQPLALPGSANKEAKHNSIPFHSSLVPHCLVQFGFCKISRFMKPFLQLLFFVVQPKRVNATIRVQVYVAKAEFSVSYPLQRKILLHIKLDTMISVCSTVCLFVRHAQGNPLDSEPGLTGKLLSKTNLPKWQNQQYRFFCFEKYIYIFFYFL